MKITTRAVIATISIPLFIPDATEEQRSNQYKQYLSCAAGLFATNQITK